MIRLHLGVHKTATTYLQDLFELNRGRIAAAGCAYWPLIYIRPVIAYSLWSAAQREGRFGRLRQRALRGAPFDDLGTILDSCESHVLSDENVLGWAGEALGGRCYPDAGARLARLAKVLGHRQAEVWLCLRSYPQFLASLFAEALRGGGYMTVPDLIAANQAPGGQWQSLVDNVHRALPDARIVVWRYEQFGMFEPVIVERLTGVPLAEMQRLSSEDVRPSPSAMAIAAHIERAEPMKVPLRVQSMAMAETEFPLVLDADRFDPWRQDQAASMAAAYERDMAEIGGRPYVELLGT